MYLPRRKMFMQKKKVSVYRWKGSQSFIPRYGHRYLCPRPKCVHRYKSLSRVERKREKVLVIKKERVMLVIKSERDMKKERKKERKR